MTVAFKIPQITTEIGPGGLLHSLFSTIAYHLESGNWGSKYPVIMNNLYNGKLEAKNAKEAFIEVRAIKEQLELLSPDKVIWNIEDLSEKAPWGSEIGDHIKNVAMFYITKNGLNLVDELVDNIQDISNNGGNLEIISYEGDHPPFSTQCIFFVSCITRQSRSLVTLAGENCNQDKASESIIESLFSGQENIHSLLWWDDPDGKVVNARSFIINGHDLIPIFSSEAEAKAQLSGSVYEKDLVSVKPSLLADILQKMEYTILNPGGKNPIQFKSCVLIKYAEQK